MAKKYVDPTRSRSLPHTTPTEYRDYSIKNADEFTVTVMGGRGVDGRVIRETQRFSVSPKGNWEPAMKLAREAGQEMADRLGRGALIYAICKGSGVHADCVDPSGQKYTMMPKGIEEDRFKG